MTATLQTKQDFDRLCKETDFTTRFRRIMANRYAGTEPDPQDIDIADAVRDAGWELVHYANNRGVTATDVDAIMTVLTDPIHIPGCPRVPRTR